MSNPLAAFVRRQLELRGEAPEAFAARAGLGVSHLYQILRGERRHPRQDTMEKLAAGFGMTPAQFVAAMAGATLQAEHSDPRLVDITTWWNELPEDRRESMHLLARSVKPVPPTHRGVTKRDAAGLRERNRRPNRPADEGQNGSGGVLPGGYHDLRDPLTLRVAQPLGPKVLPRAS